MPAARNERATTSCGPWLRPPAGCGRKSPRDGACFGEDLVVGERLNFTSVVGGQAAFNLCAPRCIQLCGRRLIERLKQFIDESFTLVARQLLSKDGSAAVSGMTTPVRCRQV
jgi:hypothetical protein